MFIHRPDAQLFAVSFGAAPNTLLAFGGWVGSWELWLEPFQALSQSWRAVAFDHRGSGATITEPGRITFESMVDDILAVADACGIERCVLAAESAGVAVALQAASRYPDRFAGLVCIAGLYRRTRRDQGDPFLMSLQNDYGGTLDEFVDACVPEPGCEAIRRWGRQIVGRTSRQEGIQLYETLIGVDLRTKIPNIRQRALVIHGTADRIQPIDESRWLAANLPNSRFVELNGAGHVPTMTRGAEVASLISDHFVPNMAG